MAELRWSEQAVYDIEEVLSGIGRTSPTFATVVGDEIRDVADSLTALPLLGAMVPEYGRVDIRERQVRSW
jgi:plasmid stabilization system protein ParE